MKVVCSREKLLAAFQTVAPVAPVRSPKPILKNIKLEVGQAGTTMLATDLELGIHREVEDVEVSTPGAAILPIDRFGSILRESMDETLKIEADLQGTLVEGQRSEFRLPAEDPAEFPAVAVFQEENYYEVSTRLLREMIRRTVLAIDTESSRYALGGVLLEVEGERMTAVGTDGRRLAKMEGAVVPKGEPERSAGTIIIPGRAMQLIDRALLDGEGTIQIAPGANEILVKSQRATIYSRLLEGRFPRWREVFPERENPLRIELPVGPLHAAVRQAAIITSEESRGIDFCFRCGSLVLSGQTPDVGQARVELPIGYDGDEVSIMLDPRYVSDVLKVLDPERTIILELVDAEGAVVLRTDDGYGYVIMPLSRDRMRGQK
jgi:DNA polymerase-3 subunit beta